MPMTLSLRELNRTFLHRQWLLQRQDQPALSAVQQLVGLQSQIPNPPYIGLWSRLDRFERDSLTGLMEARLAVRVPAFRSTLHVMSAADYRVMQPVFLPALIKGMNSFHGRNLQGLDLPALIKTVKPYLAQAPRTMGEIKDFLLRYEPERMGEALNYAVRTLLPLVQVPPGGTWGSGTMAKYALAEDWLGGMGEPMSPLDLFKRYLSAAGPANVMDFQTWAGLTNLQKELAPYRDQFTLYQTTDGRELWDIPASDIIGGETPAPIRFVPEYDNLLISHQDRTRIIADVDKPKVFLSAARVASTVLIDGFVGAVWKIEKPTKTSIAIAITPFAPLSADVRDEIIAEGEKLARWLDANAPQIAVELHDI